MAGVAPILVLGATGYTGRLVVEALERIERHYVLAGRNTTELAKVAGPHCQDIRRADALDSASLRLAFEDTTVVISTVGPFATFGIPVLEAAIEMGCHYTDTSAEQSYLWAVGELDQRARDRGVTAIPGNGCDFGFAFLGARIASDAVGDASHICVHQWLTDFMPSRGTATSAIAHLKAKNLVLAHGKITARHDLGLHRKRVQNLDGWAVPWTGAEPVTLVRDFPSLRDAECYLVLSRTEAIGFALGGKIGRRVPQVVLDWSSHRVDGMPEPSEADRKAATFTVLVEAEGHGEVSRVRIDGSDVYGITGDLVAITAAHLADGRALKSGVRTTGVALDPFTLLADLADRGVTLTRPSVR